MKTISSAVEYLINEYPFIEEGIQKNLINFSSLARELMPDIEKLLNKKANLGAVVMAIKRMSIEMKNGEKEDLEKLVSQIGDITVRSGLVDITYINSNTIVEKQIKLLEKIKQRMDVFYTFSQGVMETTMIASNSLVPVIDELFADERKVSKKENLASMTVKLPNANSKVIGVYYLLFRKIAWKGINILDVISTTNEFSLVVHEDYIDQLFSTLKQLKFPASKMQK